MRNRLSSYLKESPCKINTHVSFPAKGQVSLQEKAGRYHHDQVIKVNSATLSLNDVTCCLIWGAEKHKTLLSCHSCQHALAQSNQETDISFRLRDILHNWPVHSNCHPSGKKTKTDQGRRLTVKGDVKTCFSIHSVRAGLNLELKLFS